MRVVVRLLIIAVFLLVTVITAAAGLAIESRSYSQRYIGQIYPGVSVYGAELGGQTVSEATEMLRAVLPAPALLTVTLRHGERTWTRSWADLGFHFDPGSTAELAYRMGREGTPEDQYLEQMRLRIAGRALAPVVVLPDADQARRALEEVAPALLEPPVNASLRIHNDGTIEPLPAQVGRELDITETVSLLPHAVGIRTDGLVLELLTRQVPPAIGNPGEAMVEAETFLATPFILTGRDALTGFEGSWPVDRATMAGWLSVQEVQGEHGPRLQLTISGESVPAYLEELSARIGQGVGIDVQRTAPAMRAAVERSEHTCGVVLVHLPTTYVVQPGDTLMSIGRAHGFPLWRLLQVNPEIDASRLNPGQEVVIPSLDVLLPLPLITERRIDVSIAEQRLRAYEGDMLIFDFIASTGIATSPTIPGTFQILDKEELAYASNWDLWMPHFMGIYRTGPDFTNGIHGLPTLSSGRSLWEGYLGRPVSYGCIVIGLEEAAQLFEWTEIGTLVIIRP
ncbi:MAG: L,D-transpeptidase family protein [Chloroflexi bacterium]|nr:L,D-transpeptidase family protein [Chloroflexota bacterium]